MAGTLVVDSLKASSGVLATQNGMTGIAKAWVNFNGVPATPTIYGSFNVSSVTKGGTGNYTVNLTTAMASTNFAVANTVKPDTDRLACAGERYNVTRTTSSYGVSTGDASVYYDASIISSTLFGA